MAEYDDIRARQGLANRRGAPVNRVTLKRRRDELLRLLLAGHTTKECARALRLSVYTVRDYIRDMSFQEELKSLSEEVWRRVDEELKTTMVTRTQRIEDLSERALARIEELIESDDERVAVRAASDILDRHPETSKHHKVESNKKVVVVNAADLMLAAQTAKEMDEKILEGK